MATEQKLDVARVYFNAQTELDAIQRECEKLVTRRSGFENSRKSAHASLAECVSPHTPIAVFDITERYRLVVTFKSQSQPDIAIVVRTEK